MNIGYLIGNDYGRRTTLLQTPRYWRRVAGAPKQAIRPH